MAKITIDGVEHECEVGENLFEAIADARGEKLPHFCYHPGLSIAGVCRMCQVEVEGVPKLPIACNSRVQDGMVVRTQVPKVQETVQQILNFHLLHHPVDCPVCDQAGECSLQDIYMDHGLYEASIELDDKMAKGKVKPIGEHVMLDAERCVLCARCTRFTDEITHTHEMGIFNRGNHSEVDVAPGMTLDNGYSLNTVDICPVGALTSRDFRFQKRVWRLDEAAGICPGCATGCNMNIHSSEGVVHRLQPRENAAVNEWWMCDHGRLLYHGLHGDDRLQRPMLRDAESGVLCPSTWTQAYQAIDAGLSALGEARKIVLVASPHASVEELHAFASLLGSAGGDLLGYRLMDSEMGEADELLLSADRTPNAEGARRLGMAEFDAASLDAVANENTVLFVLANDLAGLEEEAAAAVAKFGLVVHISPRVDATARLAHITLAAHDFAEREGLFVNGGGRVQHFEKAIDGPEDARDPLQVIADLGELLGHVAVWKTASDLRAELAARVDEFAAIAQGVGALGLALDDSAEGAEVKS